MPTADPASEGAAGTWSGQLCRNCGARLQGRYCSACGQAAAQADQLSDLLREWLRRLLQTEPILWGTLRLLIWNPGKLTHDWWAGRRARLMSPVRTLLSVLVVGTAVAVVWNTLSGRVTGVPGILMGFTYKAALVTILVSVRVLPGLLPKAQRRTSYERAVFALYECAFLCLLMLSAVSLLLLADLAPWLAAFGSVLAPIAIPLVAGVASVHAVVHLWKAFGLSLVGAIARSAGLTVFLAVGMLLVSILFAATGLDGLWTPPISEMSTFRQR